MNKFEDNYFTLAEHVLDFGNVRPSRVGSTVSIFGCTLHIKDLSENRFPIMTTRQIHVHPIMGELACFLKGTDKLQDFIDAGCNYWTPNAEAWFENKGLTRDKMSVGVIYGVQWRNWQSGGEESLDQLHALVNGIKEDPHGRRHVVTAWQPGELADMCLPPCHILFQCYVEGNRLSMCVYMRSVDICLGLPTDIVLYATLLKLICNETSYHPGNLIFLMGDAHIYTNHISSLKDQLRKGSCDLPEFKLTSTIDTFKPGDLELLDYTFKRGITYELNI